MLYSGYLSIYLLQSLNLDISQTQLVQEIYTNMDDLFEDTLFPEDGPVFMQRVHEFRHPVAMSSEENIQRRFGDINVPATKATFKDPAVNPDYGGKNPFATEIPIQKVYDTSVFIPQFDFNPYTKENNIQTLNEPPANDYEEYHTAIETTVQNVVGTRNYKTGVTTAKIDDANPGAEIPNIVNGPNDPKIPKTYDDYYPTGSKSPAQVLDDPLMDGPGLNPKAYAEINPIDKNIERYNDPLTEPTFITQKFDVTQPRTTTEIKRKRSYNTPLIKSIADFFYPEIETTTELRLGYRTGKGGVFFIKRSHTIDPSIPETAIQGLLGSQKLSPVLVVKSDNNMKKTTTQGLNRLILNEVSFMQELRNLKIRDTTRKISKDDLRNETEFVQNYDVHHTKKVTNIQRAQEIETNKPFDGPPKIRASEFELKVNKGYPITLGTTDFIHNDDIYSPTTETVSQILRETQKYKSLLKKIINVTNTQKRVRTIQKFQKPLSIGPNLEAKLNKDNPISFDITDFMQDHDLNSITETASQISSETYPQKSKFQILSKPSRNEPDFEPNVDEVSYPAALETEQVHIQRFDDTISPILTKRFRTQSFTSASLISSVKSLLNPSFPSNYPEQHETALTVPDLALSSENGRPIATQKTSPESDLVYPWIKNPNIPGSMKPWTPRTVYLEPTFESSDLPTTILKFNYHEATPEILRVRMPEPIQLKQETYTIIAEPIDNIMADRLPKQNTRVRAERLKLKDNRAFTEKLEPEEDTEAPAEKLEEGEGTEPFSTFLKKLMKVLATKSLRDLLNLIQPFERYVTTLVDSGKLMKLGAATGSFIALSTPLLRAPVMDIQRYLFVVQISLENPRQMLDDDTIEMLNEMDDIYDIGEEEAMQRILHEIKLFPNTSRNEEQIIQDFVDDIFLHPMHRVAGTTKGNVVFEHIAKFVNKLMSSLSTYSRRNQKHEGDISKDIFSLDEDLDRDPRKKSEGKITLKNDFSTRRSKRKGKMVIDLYSSDSKRYESNGDRSGVVIRIRINSGKHSKDKSRNNSRKIKKKHFGKYDKKYSTPKINSAKNYLKKQIGRKWSRLEKSKKK